MHTLHLHRCVEYLCLSPTHEIARRWAACKNRASAALSALSRHMHRAGVSCLSRMYEATRQNCARTHLQNWANARALCQAGAGRTQGAERVVQRVVRRRHARQHQRLAVAAQRVLPMPALALLCILSSFSRMAGMQSEASVSMRGTRTGLSPRNMAMTALPAHVPRQA